MKNLKTIKTKPVRLNAPLTVMEVSKLAKIKLIRKFQRAEGNFDCCATSYARVCDQVACLWRDVCL